MLEPVSQHTHDDELNLGHLEKLTLDAVISVPETKLHLNTLPQPLTTPKLLAERPINSPILRGFGLLALECQESVITRRLAAAIAEMLTRR